MTRTTQFESQTTHNRINLIKYLARETSMSKKLSYIERYEKKVIRDDMERFWYLLIVWLVLAVLACGAYLVT